MVSMIALGVTIFFLSKNSKDNMYQQLDQHMKNYSQHKEVIDNLQSNVNIFLLLMQRKKKDKCFICPLIWFKLPCCGLDNYSDWINIVGEIPGSCCESSTSCDETEINISELPPGCFDNLNELLNYYGEILVIVLIVLGGVEVILNNNKNNKLSGFNEILLS